MKTRPSSEKGLIHNIEEISNIWELYFVKNLPTKFAGQYKNKDFCFAFAPFALKESEVVMSVNSDVRLPGFKS